MSDILLKKEVKLIFRFLSFLLEVKKISISD